MEIRLEIYLALDIQKRNIVYLTDSLLLTTLPIKYQLILCFCDCINYCTYNAIIIIIISIVMIEIWTEMLVPWSLEMHLMRVQISLGLCGSVVD
jgi:hypothetical protein